MSAAEAQSEPTMEEILASIRKIISEDDAKPAEAADEGGAGFDDVLELGGAEVAPQAEDEETHVSPDFDFDSLGFDEESTEQPSQMDTIVEETFDNDEIIGVDIEPEVVYEAPPLEPAYVAPVASSPISFDPPPAPPPIYPEAAPYVPRTSNMPPHLAQTVGLIGADAANAATEAFAKLGTALPNHFASGASVEELVAYLLKPMLKEWLDNNLPRIVEERVEAELARIARRGF